MDIKSIRFLFESFAKHLVSRRSFTIGASALLLCFIPASMADIKDIQKKYRAEARRYGFSLNLKDSLATDKNGSPVSEEELDKCLGRFFFSLNSLERGFVKKSKISKVVFKDSLVDPLSGKHVQGLAGDGTISLSKDFSAFCVYHELFHVFDGNSNGQKWCKINPKGFVYTGSEFRPANLSKKDSKKAEESKGGTMDEHFVSAYAQSNDSEDRAETFAHMIVEGYDFLSRTEKSEPLRKKMELIIDITDSRNLLGQGFWETLMAKDVSEIKRFSESAFAIRLLKDIKSKDMNPNETINVAGRKIVPLILALHQDNTELVLLLCTKGADPNVQDDKKRSALLLAINNDDEEQVKALLQNKAVIGPNELKAVPEKDSDMLKLLKDAKS